MTFIDDYARARDIDLPRWLLHLVIEWEIMYYGNYSAIPMYFDGRTDTVRYGRQYLWEDFPPFGLRRACG